MVDATFFAPHAASAIPVFANAQGVSCEVCHTAPPNLTSYGRYILATNFTGAFQRASAAGGEGQSIVASLQYLFPSSRLTGGLSALQGTFPAAVGCERRLTRTMALVSYAATPKIAVNVIALIGHDNNPNDDGSGPVASNGISYEAIYGPMPWLHLDLRYDHTNDGLGAVAKR